MSLARLFYLRTGLPSLPPDILPSSFFLKEGGRKYSALKIKKINDEAHNLK